MTDGEIFDQALINIELELQDHILTFEKESKCWKRNGLNNVPALI